MSPKRVVEEEVEEVSVTISDVEYKVAQELLSERKAHRDVLTNLHLIYRREDARRILDNMPYQSCQMLPILRKKNERQEMHWLLSETGALSTDLRIKFEYYCKHGLDFMASAAHGLIKKVEDARPK